MLTFHVRVAKQNNFDVVQVNFECFVCPRKYYKSFKTSNPYMRLGCKHCRHTNLIPMERGEYRSVESGDKRQTYKLCLDGFYRPVTEIEDI